jgi:hypothetical protein
MARAVVCRPPVLPRAASLGSKKEVGPFPPRLAQIENIGCWDQLAFHWGFQVSTKGCMVLWEKCFVQIL